MVPLPFPEIKSSELYNGGVFNHNLVKFYIEFRRKLMRLPNKKECFALIHKMKMPEHIINHSIQVSRVALFLTDQLTIINKNGLNRDLVLSAALLHDITKPGVLKPEKIMRKPEGNCFSTWIIRKWVTSLLSMYDCGYTTVLIYFPMKPKLLIIPTNECFTIRLYHFPSGWNTSLIVMVRHPNSVKELNAFGKNLLNLKKKYFLIYLLPPAI
jgi:hypothetical protein